MFKWINNSHSCIFSMEFFLLIQSTLVKTSLIQFTWTKVFGYLHQHSREHHGPESRKAKDYLEATFCHRHFTMVARRLTFLPNRSFLDYAPVSLSSMVSKLLRHGFLIAPFCKDRRGLSESPSSSANWGLCCVDIQ